MPSLILSMLKRNAWRFSFAWFGTLFEMVLFALSPWLLGKAIDGMQTGSSTVFSWYVGLLAVLFITGIFRRMYDTRVFSGAWRHMANEVLGTMIGRKVESKRILTAQNLCFRFADFFEWNVQNMARGIVEFLVGSIVLCLTLPAVGSISVCLGMVGLVCRWFEVKKRGIEDHKLQQTQDDVNDAVVNGDMAAVEKGNARKAKLFIKMSDYEAVGWGCCDLLYLVSEIMVVLALVKSDAQPGEILACVSYVWRMFGGISSVGFGGQQLNGVFVAEKKLENDLKG